LLRPGRRRKGNAIRLFFELRAGGYDGSTYTLAYDPKKDILYGVYYQANARKRYDIYFERAEIGGPCLIGFEYSG
jgi:hypothetical protein